VPSPSGPSEALFATRWVHAFEEDTADFQMYRPEADDVPLSRRPRTRLEFERDGSARVLTGGPDDRPTATTATWRQEGDEVVVQTGAGVTLRVSVRSSVRIGVRREP
jgi:hypothetical protein